jgi:hypothetical protein
MKLWDMLDKAMYFQKVWIFETNAYDQNMPIYKGNVQGAREEGDLVWDYLPCEVENYACSDGILDIRVRNDYYNERIEGHYSISAENWGKSKEQRPWRHSIEIEQEKREAGNA